jgi:hypothetical protein
MKDESVQQNNPQASDIMDSTINYELQREAQESAGVQPNFQVEDELVKWWVETIKEIDNIELTLLGKKRINNVDIEVSEPVINKDAINSAMIDLKLQANKITSLTTFSDEMINIDCKNFRKIARDKLVYNRRKWGISRKDLPSITQNLDTLMNAILNKGKEALMLKSLRQQVQIKEFKNTGNAHVSSKGMPNI